MVGIKQILPENRRFYATTQQAYSLGILGHSVYLMLFGWTGAMSLFYSNLLLSVPALLLALFLNGRGKHNMAFNVAFGNLFLQASFGVYVLGWDSGFQYWFILLAGLSFFSSNWSVWFRRTILVLLAGAFAGAYSCTYFGLQTELSTDWLKLITFAAYGNGLSVLIGLALLINYYTQIATRAERAALQANDKLKQQNDEIQRKNEEIVKSMNYAERIQQAVIPSEEILRRHFKAYFVLFQPKNIVSGDFYWFSEIDNKIIVICADSTGHGVPGGFLSMFGISLVNEIVNHQRMAEPARILEAMRTRLKAVLGQSVHEKTDGIAVTACVFDLQAMQIAFAGANNGVYLIRKGSLLEYKPTANPIGSASHEIPFTEEMIPIQQGDKIYFYTDGFLEQFQGESEDDFMQELLKTKLLEFSGRSMVEQKLAFDDCFRNWTQAYEQIDDCTLIAVEV